MRHRGMRYSVAFLCALFFALPISASLPAEALAKAGAATATPSSPSRQAKFEVTGWIPYWRVATGTADTLPHLDVLTEINPFVYTIRADGTLRDNGALDQEPWLSFIAAAKEKKVRVVPTIMSSGGENLHKILSNRKLRIALEDRIAALVKEKGYDGIDIDFEGKYAKDKDFFSSFLYGLMLRLPKSAMLMCTIESRTPLADQYYGTTRPADAGKYANDLKKINKYCDRVRVMTYDQQNIDRKLAATAASSSQIYAPVADIAWVEKSIRFMLKDISKSKLLIGVPTYGYEYAVTAYEGKEYIYDILWTFNPRYATDIAAQYGITPQRNSAGEMHFTYVADAPTSPANGGASTTPVSLGPTSALLAALAATTYADSYKSHMDFRLVGWPDAQSMQQKIDLAKRLGVRGISIFKLDGGQDPNIWSVLQGVAIKDPLDKPASAAPRVTGSTIIRTLRLGSVGEDVRTLQRLLNSDSATRIATSGAGSPGQETNRFGTLTVRAVQKFQVKYGIAKAGVVGYGQVGPKTRAKLNAMLAGL